MQDSLDIEGVGSVLKKWMKQIILFVVAATLLALGVAFILPKKYRSAAIIIPGNSAFADRGRIFNNNIQQLYSAYGNADDLDRLYAMAISKPVAMFLVDTFKLVDHYQLKNDETPAVEKAIKKLKRNTNVTRRENGELQIEVWDEDPELASNIANATVEMIQKISHEAMLNSYQSTLAALKDAYNRKKMELDSTVVTDSTGNIDILKGNTNNTHQELDTYRKAIDEIEINMNTDPPAFIILEKAYRTYKWDKPDVVLIVVAAFFLSLMFGILSAIIVEKVK